MNLIVDIGNTSLKGAVYSDGKIIDRFRSASSDLHQLVSAVSRHPIKRAIVSSVAGIPEGLLDAIESKGIRVLILTGETPLPFGSDYETPGTLGMDRLAAVAGAYNFSGHNDVLVIDAGTAITYDQLTGGRYNGGTISPGLTMRFRALNEFTARLPLVSPAEVVAFPAVNTNSAIATGVVDGLVFEINEYIRRFRKKGAGGMVFITGGDAEFLSERITEKATLRPELVTEGLNFILNYNA